MKYRDSSIVDLLCAEHVLGTLAGAARRRFERLIEQRPDLRRRREEWDLRLNAMAVESVEVVAPPGAWAKVLSRIDGSSSGSNEPGLTQRLSFWRGLTLASWSAAIVMAILLVMPGQAPDAPGYVVMLRDEHQTPIWVIKMAPDAAQLLVNKAGQMDMPAGKRCDLWLQPPGSENPYRLGSLPDQGQMTIAVPENLKAMIPGQFLVSIEDADAPDPRHPDTLIQMQGEWLAPLANRT